MPIRFSGLASGMDTDSIVQQLVKAQSEKKTKLVKQQTKLGWTQTVWKDLNAKVYKLHRDTMDNIRTQGAYRKKASTVSDSKIAKIVSGESSVNGSQTLAVTQLSKMGYLTGGKLNGSASLSTKLSELTGLAAGDTAQLGVNLSGGGGTVKVNGDDTIESFMAKLKKTGVSVNFDETNQRFFINSTASGAAGDFSMVAENAGGLDLLKGLKLVTASDITGGSSGPATEYDKWAAMQGANDSATKSNPDFMTLAAKEAAERAKNYMAYTKDLNDKITVMEGEITKLQQANSDYRLTQGFKDAMAALDPTALKTPADVEAEWKTKIQTVETEQKDYDELSAKPPGDLTTDEQSRLTYLQNQKDTGAWNSLDADKANYSAVSTAVEYDKVITTLQDTIVDFQDTITDNQTYYTVSTVTDADGNITNTAAATQKLYDVVEAEFVKKVNTAADAIAGAGGLPTGVDAAVRVKGQDAEILLNGAKFTSTNNSFAVNGLTITATEVSEMDSSGVYKPTTINTEDDVEGIYQTIKGFFKEYNSLIKEIDKLYGAASSKGYEVLSDEDKEAMTDDQIKDWEAKIKDALLRRDGNLGSLSGKIKGAMTKSYTINGTQMDLHTFGIETLGYFAANAEDRNVYFIAGDKDDPNAKNQTEDRLKTALTKDPNAVGDFFASLVTGVYDTLTKEMNRTDYRTMYNVYDDKKMQKEYDSYTKKIKEQEKKLAAMEDKYYKQFTAMEKAMSKLNSQQSSLASMLGTG